MNFTKSDLKTGMILVHRCGDKSRVLLGTVNGDLFAGETWGSLGGIRENLTNSYDSDMDVIQVIQPKHNLAFTTLDLKDEDIEWTRKIKDSRYIISIDLNGEALSLADLSEETLFDLRQQAVDEQFDEPDN